MPNIVMLFEVQATLIEWKFNYNKEKEAKSLNL